MRQPPQANSPPCWRKVRREYDHVTPVTQGHIAVRSGSGKFPQKAIIPLYLQ